MGLKDGLNSGLECGLCRMMHDGMKLRHSAEGVYVMGERFLDSPMCSSTRTNRPWKRTLCV